MFFLKKKKKIAPKKKDNSRDTSAIIMEEFQKTINASGYDYDPEQDIFYSTMYPWQREFGYCHLYDEACAPWGMIIDSEPIYFEYNGLKWMICMWKGQFDYVTGGEIGIYTEAASLNIPSLFDGYFYNCASDENRLHMSFSLYKNNQKLFYREDLHWWLTGFKLGEFSEPSELIMDVNITLHNEVMCTAFVEGLKNTGYSDNEFLVEGNSVKFKFSAPHTKQPITRTPLTDWIVQRKNEFLCKKYREITNGCNNMEERISLIKKEYPYIYEQLINIGKQKKYYDTYKIIKDYLI